MTKQEIENIVLSCVSYSAMCRKLGLSHTRYAKKLCQEHGIDTSHFSHKKSVSHRVKYPTVKKSCPVCGKQFETKSGHKREKITCSYSCSNTYFRSGTNNPNWRGYDVEHQVAYRRICFDAHGKKCIVCGEDKIVAVHHYDENNKNNDPSNLIPLCPTHHLYVHSRYKDEVMPVIEEFIKK